jgi:hypothetical protein
MQIKLRWKSCFWAEKQLTAFEIEAFFTFMATERQDRVMCPGAHRGAEYTAAFPAFRSSSPRAIAAVLGSPKIQLLGHKSAPVGAGNTPSVGYLNDPQNQCLTAANSKFLGK